MLPQEFKRMMAELGLSDAVEAIEQSVPEVSVRTNRHKPSARLSDQPVPWCEDGCYLKERPVFALDPCWHQGRYYVQEAGSMFVSHVVRSLAARWTGPVCALDACAAPGGKTTAVIDALPQGSLMVANEYVPARAAVLKENIVKWGSPSVIVTRGDTARLARLGETFDLVVADVPCSGEGMMRKDDEAVAQWGEGLVRDCAALQWEIVCNLWQTIRPGGVMIYSTCTFNRQEDELNVARILRELGGESVEIAVPADWGITGAIGEPSLHAYRFIPGRTRGEGLFVSVIRKKGFSETGAQEYENSYRTGAQEYDSCRASQESYKGRKGRPDKGDKRGAVAKVPSQLSDWLADGSRYALYADGDRVNAFPREWMPVLERVRKVTDVIHDGVHVASLKGHDYAPAHALVMSSAFNKSAFPHVDIDKDTALRYLRGESPVMPEGTPRGYVVLTYDGEPLGLVKNLGNRSNSLYPSAWKLRVS